jgi:lipase chaperone LimK
MDEQVALFCMGHRREEFTLERNALYYTEVITGDRKGGAVRLMEKLF